MDVRRARAGRFSLLLLDDGEVLITDIACEYRMFLNTDCESGSSSFPSRLCGEARSGRVKVGTRNIFFDSDDWRDPVVKIPITSVTCVALSRAPSVVLSPRRSLSRVLSSPSRSSSPLWRSPRRTADRAPIAVDMTQLSLSPSRKTDTVIVDSTIVIFQREHGADHPYTEAQIQGKHLLSPMYAEACTLEAELESLKNINAISSRRAREAALLELVQEREKRIPFDITLLQYGSLEGDGRDFAASAIYALSRAPGRVKITSKNLYFMPIHGDANRSVECVHLNLLVSVRRLRHGCSNAALEVAFAPTEAASLSESQTGVLKTLMLTFDNIEARELAFSSLVSSVNKKIDIYDKNELHLALAKWRRGEMSNYDYLMYLNMASGRSFNDLSQYPVFPWILSDYTSNDLNLDDPAVFRDLSKPIGALDEMRLAALKQRYHEMPPPRFFYGTHYSTPAYLINYLVRAAPGAMLRLQNGRFDMPDRLFHSMAETWKGVCSNPADVKELIPEFYALDYSKNLSSGIVASNAAAGQFLENVLGLELGTRQDGKRVDAVELPPWAKGSSSRFVRKLREALECQIVSERLHQWIDLIFGFKSRNEDACNIFYTDVALPNSLNSQEMRALTYDDIAQMETIYLEFGRTPNQIFFHSHPSRFENSSEITANNSTYLFSQSSIAPIVSSISSESDSAARWTIRGASDGGPNANTGLNRKQSSMQQSAHAKDVNELKIKCMRSLPDLAEKSSKKSMFRLKSSSSQLKSAKTSKNSLEGSSLTSFMLGSSQAHVKIVDATLVDVLPRARPSEISMEKKSSENKEENSSRYAICTLSSDYYLRLNLGSEVLRSRLLDGACCVATMDSGLVAYGTANGSLGYYHINSGRAHMMINYAHESRVSSIAFVPGLHILISGARDASVKVWQVQRVRNSGACALLCALELDAESPVLEISATCNYACSCSHSEDEGLEWAVRRLVIAALTADGSLLVWQPTEYSAGDALLDIQWRLQLGQVSQAPVVTQRMCWLSPVHKKSRAIAVISPCGEFVRVWIPGKEMSKVLIRSVKATCVASIDDSCTLLVGNDNGVVEHYDETGFCIGRRETEAYELMRLLVRGDGGGLFSLGSGKIAVQM